MKILEHVNTKVKAMPMAMPLFAEVVTANAEQIPITILKIGFSFHKPLIKSLNNCMTKNSPPTGYILTILSSEAFIVSATAWKRL